MRSSRASRVFRLIGAAVFVAFVVWFTVRSAALAQDADSTRLAASQPVVFEGSVRYTSVVRGGGAEEQLGVTHNRGKIYVATAEISEPRLDGEHTFYFNADNYSTPGEPTSVGAGTWRIECTGGTCAVA